MTDSEAAAGIYERFKAAMKKIKREILAVYYAVQDPAVGYVPRLIAALAVGYALSPLDLIPDVIPVLGLLDDLIILPALLWLAIKLIPEEAMQRGRERAASEPLRLASNWIAAVLFFVIWNVCFGAIAWWLVQHFGSVAVKDMQWWIVGGVVGVAAVGEVIWATIQIRGEREKAEAAALATINQPLLDEP